MKVKKLLFAVIGLVIYSSAVFSQSSIFRDSKTLADFLQNNPTPVFNFSEIQEKDLIEVQQRNSEIEITEENPFFNLPSFGDYTISIKNDTNLFHLTLMDDTIHFNPPATDTIFQINISYSPNSFKVTDASGMEIYQKELPYRKVWSILNAHSSFRKTDENVFMQFQKLGNAYDENPFLQNLSQTEFGLDNLAAGVYKLDAESRNEYHQALTSFKTQNYEWQQYLYGDSVLNLQKTVSYKDVVDSYRQPIVQAKDQLEVTNELVHESNQDMNFLDAKTIAVGLSDFIAERAQEELNVTFFNRFKKNMNKQSEISILFPNTKGLLGRFKISDYKTLLANARESFVTDLDNLGLNFPKVLELPRYHDLYNSPEVYNVALIYGIANLAYQDKSVENILIYGYEELNRRNIRLSEGINEELAKAILSTDEKSLEKLAKSKKGKKDKTPKISKTAALPELENRVISYLDALDSCKFHLQENYKLLASEVNNQLTTNESFQNNNLVLKNDYFLKQSTKDLKLVHSDDDFSSFQKNIVEKFQKNIIVHSTATIDESATNFYRNVIPSNLNGDEYFGYVMRSPKITDYDFFFQKDSIETYKVIGQGLKNSRKLLTESERYNQIVSQLFKKIQLHEEHLRSAKTNYLFARLVNQGQEKQIQQLIFKKELLENAIKEEVDFWKKATQDSTGYHMAALQFLDAVVKQDIYLELFSNINEQLENGKPWAAIETKYHNTLDSANFGANIRIANNILDSISMKLEKKVEQLVNNKGRILINPNLYAQKRSASTNAQLIAVQMQLDSLESVFKNEEKVVKANIRALRRTEFAEKEAAIFALVAERNTHDEGTTERTNLQTQIDKLNTELSALDEKYTNERASQLDKLKIQKATQEKILWSEKSRIEKTSLEGKTAVANASIKSIHKFSENGYHQSYLTAKANESKIDSTAFEKLDMLRSHFNETETHYYNLIAERKKLDNYLSLLDTTFCADMVKAQRNAQNLAKGLEYTIHGLFAFRDTIETANVIKVNDSLRYVFTENEYDSTGNTLIRSVSGDTLHVNPKNLPLNIKDKKTTRWISRKQFESLRTNEVQWNIFLGLLYQRLKGVDNSPGFDAEGVALLTTKFLNITNNLSLYRRQLKIKRAKEERITFHDYYPFIQSAVDLFNTTITTNSIGATTMADRFNSLGGVPELSNEALSLYENIHVKEYGDAVLNVVGLLKIISAGKLNKSDAKKSKFGINAVLKYGTFMADMVNAESSTQVKDILKAATLPPGSSRIKRTVTSNLSINAYLGVGLGMENMRNAPDFISSADKSRFGASLSVPIGLTYSFSPDFLKRNHSFSIFVPLLDVGAITMYRFGASGEADVYNIERIPELEWDNLFAPGLFAVYNAPNSPLSVGFGGQRGPSLRKIEVTNGDPVFVNSFRFPMVFISIDVPFFNLHTGPEKIIVK